MKVKILTSSALVNQETGRWAGLAETVDVPRERGEYLVSVGAAEAVDDGEQAPEAESEVPQGDDGKAAGTSTDEPKSEEKKAAPAVRRPAPKTK